MIKVSDETIQEIRALSESNKAERDAERKADALREDIQSALLDAYPGYPKWLVDSLVAVIDRHRPATEPADTPETIAPDGPTPKMWSKDSEAASGRCLSMTCDKCKGTLKTDGAGTFRTPIDSSQLKHPEIDGRIAEYGR